MQSGNIIILEYVFNILPASMWRGEMWQNGMYAYLISVQKAEYGV